jgi:hypothetical protein
LLAFVSSVSLFPPRTADLGLGTDGDRLTVDGRPTFLLIVSYFDGLRAVRLEEDFAYFRDVVGAGGVRVLPNWRACDENMYEPQCPPADDGLFDARTNEVRPDRLEALRRLVELAGAHDLVVDVTFTRETLEPEMSVDAYRNGILRTAEALKPFRNVLFDIQNEFDKNGLTVAEVAAIRAAIRQVDRSRIVTASGSGAYGPEEAAQFAVANGMNLITVHDPREEGSWFLEETADRIVSQALKAAAPTKLPVYLQEPTGWGSRSDDDVEGDHFRRAARAAKRAGAAAWTFHQRVGFNLQRESFRSRITRDEAMKRTLESLMK